MTGGDEIRKRLEIACCEVIDILKPLSIPEKEYVLRVLREELLRTARQQGIKFTVLVLGEGERR